MIEIEKETNGSVLTVFLKGRLDTLTAPKFESELDTAVVGCSELILDLTHLEYISSAGLRVILHLKNQMDVKSEMKIRNVNSGIMEIFEITGLTSVLTIENNCRDNKDIRDDRDK
ncbi:MAG: STAS domain-containing protein [Planctomycetaceae bacterium]|jgi:anti-anti-sigma factor|nr:STAS domain-containing protein [Planctomycetaceae bacterium]